MKNENQIQPQTDKVLRALFIMDAGRDERDGMSQGRLVDVGKAHSAALAMELARTKFETSGAGAIGFTAERAMPA